MKFAAVDKPCDDFVHIVRGTHIVGDDAVKLFGVKLWRAGFFYINVRFVDGAKVRMDYRAVHLEPLTTEAQGGIDMKKIAPKARVY